MTLESNRHEPHTARLTQVQTLMTTLLSKSPIYGLILSDIKLLRVVRGTVTLSLTLKATHLNSKGALHGAVSATIVDFVTGLAICSWDLREKTGASVDMHLSFLSAARAGDTVTIQSTAEKVGGSLAFVTIRISKVGDDGEERLVTLSAAYKVCEADWLIDGDVSGNGFYAIDFRLHASWIDMLFSFHNIFSCLIFFLPGDLWSCESVNTFR